MKLILALIMSITMSACITVNIQGQEEVPDIADSVYQVGGERGWGTGFAVKTASGKTVIATNRHVCEIFPHIDDEALKDNQDRKWEAEIIALSEDHDLCLLKAPRNAKPLPLYWGYSVGEGVDIFTAGYPSIRFMTKTQGETLGKEVIAMPDYAAPEDCNKKTNEIRDVELFPGMKMTICVNVLEFQWTSARISGGASGSPVVNRDGEIVGVVSIATASEAGFMGMVPLEYLRDLLDQY